MLWRLVEASSSARFRLPCETCAFHDVCVAVDPMAKGTWPFLEEGKVLQLQVLTCLCLAIRYLARAAPFRARSMVDARLDCSVRMTHTLASSRVETCRSSSD